MPAKQVYSTATTRKMLGDICATTLWKLCRAGKLDGRKIGRKRVYTAESIERYLASLPTKDGAAPPTDEPRPRARLKVRVTKEQSA